MPYIATPQMTVFLQHHRIKISKWKARADCLAKYYPKSRYISLIRCG